MPPLDLPSPAYGLPLLYAANPVVTATDVAREHGAELAIGPRATEQAVHAALRRTHQLARDDHPGVVEVDPERLLAMAAELEAVRRILDRTAEALDQPDGRPDDDGERNRRGASPAAVIWVVLGSAGLVVGSVAYLLGAPVAAAAAPFGLCLLIALIATVNLRRSAQATARRQPRPAVAAEPGPADRGAAVRAARTVVEDQEQRWEETWAELGRTAPEPDPVGVDDAVAHLQFGNLLARGRTVVDLRDRPTPIVAVEPFRGIGPHRAAELRELLDDLAPGILVAIVVGVGDR